MKNAAKWLWFSQCFGMATRKLHLALARYGGPDALLDMTQHQVDSDLFLSPEQKRFVASKNLTGAQKVIEQTRAKGFETVSFEQQAFPSLLRNIFAPPVLLFYKGDSSLLNDHYLITMVGTRRPDRYGLDCAKKLASEIVRDGGVVVSGLAAGIDAACHEAALSSGGKTVAFLSTGLDSDYPVINRSLRKKIENNGLVVTEYIVGTPAAPQHFAIRNRLMSGVSLATVVVQCRPHSGSMLTANHALNQNRDLFAVPGDIFNSLSEGANRLLDDGASVAANGSTILSRYKAVYRYAQPDCSAAQSEQSGVHLPPDLSLSEDQKVILRLLEKGELGVDQLCEQTNLEVYELLPILTTLEIMSVIKATAGAKYKTV